MKEGLIALATFFVIVCLVIWHNFTMAQMYQEDGVPGSIMQLPLNTPCETLGPPIETPYKMFLQTVMFKRGEKNSPTIRQVWVKNEREIPLGKFIIKKSHDPMDMGIKIMALPAE